MSESRGSSWPPLRPSKRPRQVQPAPALPDDVIMEQILTRVPVAAAARFRAVCRTWRAALTSDHFVQAHRRAFRSDDTKPEIVFFSPRPATSAAFYRCKLEITTHQNGSSSSSTARELVTVDNVGRTGLQLPGTRPCLGLTLLRQPEPSATLYHVCNLTTGELFSLPPCVPAKNWIPYPDAHCYRLSSAGLGFDTATGEHKVVRLYEDWEKRQRCEAYGLRSGGGWRALACPVPPHAAKGLDDRRSPVFLNGRFYWHVDVESKVRFNFNGQQQANSPFSTPERILSLTLDTEQFGWVHSPEQLWRHPDFHLTDLDGSLCAVVDLRLTVEEYELWTWPPGSGSPASWSLRCRIKLASLPRMSLDLGRGISMLPLASMSGGKILLATSCHEVHAYDPAKNSSEVVFAMDDFMDGVLRDTGPLLNIALYEESITGVWYHPVAVAGDTGQRLKMKVSSNVVARREGQGQRRPRSFAITPQLLRFLGLGSAMEEYQIIINNRDNYMHN